jgi:lactoylglutathione lyase
MGKIIPLIARCGSGLPPLLFSQAHNHRQGLRLQLKFCAGTSIVEEVFLAKAIHSMIRVLNEEKSRSFYKAAFNLDVADRLDFDTFTLVYLRNDETGFELELTINKDRTEPYNLGDGYGHLAFSVDDLDTEHARLKAQQLSLRDIVEFKRDGAMLARFFFIEDPDGYKIEVLQREGRYI